MTRAEGTRRAVAFTALTFFVTYLLAFVYYSAGGRINQSWFILMAVVYMWIPASVAIVLQKLVYKEGVVGPLNVSFNLNRWWLVGWILPVMAAYLAIIVALPMPGVSFSPDMSGILERYQANLTPDKVARIRDQLRSAPSFVGWLVLFGGAIAGMIAGASINAVAAFGEELGWRGFLQRALGFMGFWRSSFLIGIIWGLWHAPLIIQGYNYPQHPRLGVLMMTLMTMLLAPILAYVTLRAKSVVVAAIGHGTFNAVAGLAILFLRGGNDLTVGMTGLAGMISLGIINLAIFLYDRRHPMAPLTGHPDASTAPAQ